MKKKLFCVVALIFLPFVLFASVGNPFSYDIQENPSKLFFSGNSVFMGEIKFEDAFALQSSPNPILQNPSIGIDVNVLGSIVGINLGVNTTMYSSGEKYDFDAIMSRHIDIFFAYGYKYFSVGVNLLLQDERERITTFNKNIPILSFLGESLFAEYVDLPSSVNSSIGLSLMLTDTEYFGFGFTMPDLFVFSSTDSVFDSTALYKSINFGLTARSPRYNKYDDLLPVVCTIDIDGLRVFDSKKDIRLGIDLSLILSPTMNVSIKNILDFYLYENEKFSLDDNKFFLHTISLIFTSKIVKVELGFKIPVLTYRTSDSAFSSFLSLQIYL